MRILLTHHLPLEGSASGRGTRALAEGLAAAGHDVLCLVVEGRRTLPSTANTFVLEHVRCWPGNPQADLAFDLPSLYGYALTRLTFDDLTEDQLVEYRNALRRKLDRAIERFDPHVIHCQHAWLFAHLALESGAPYIVSVQGPELQPAATPRYGRFVEQALENASRIVAHSRNVAVSAATLFPETASRIEVVVPAVSPDLSASRPLRQVALSLLGIRTDLPLLVVACELSPETGVGAVLNAYAELTAGPTDASLAICGEGPQKAELEAQARHQGLEHVHFLGELPSAERSTLLTLADLVIVPASESDGWRTAIEALLCGTPVVAAGSGTLREVVDDRVGILFDPRDHHRLAEILARALREEWSKSKGPAARQLAAERFSLADSVSQHAAVYEAALVQRYGSPPG